MGKGGWKTSLAGVLKENNGRKTDGTIAGESTKDARSDILFQCFNELRQLGFKLDDVHQFKGRHVQALTKHWSEKSLKSATIQNRISVLRTFSSWIGKEGMVEASHSYLPKEEVTRSSIATEDKSWSAKNISADEVIQKVSAKDSLVGLQLEFQKTFGLRVKESILLKPTLADKGSFLAVNLGTKGGRDRTVPIVTDAQRELLNRAKALVGNRSLGDPSKKLEQLQNHYYKVVRAAGITRENGITSHGLRHQYASDRYETIAGEASPVRGGNLGQSDREADYMARLRLSEELGHSREDVTTHYLGR
jgi:site-specific recombinase XerD